MRPSGAIGADDDNRPPRAIRHLAEYEQRQRFARGRQKRNEYQ